MPREHDGSGFSQSLLDRFPGGRVVARGNSESHMLALTRASVGIGVLDCFVGDSDPALRRVVEEPVSVQNMSAEVHLAMARAPRIRAVLAFLADNFRANADALVGNRLT